VKERDDLRKAAEERQANAARRVAERAARDAEIAEQRRQDRKKYIETEIDLLCFLAQYPGMYEQWLAFEAEQKDKRSAANAYRRETA
jgi:hypothetical protein